MNEHGGRNKSKWYRFSKPPKKPLVKVTDVNVVSLSVPKNIKQNVAPESPSKFESKPTEDPPFKNIPFKLRLSKRFSSMDDIYMRRAQQKEPPKDNSIILFIRSIIPDLTKMNPGQMHQFRLRTLSTIGDILYNLQPPLVADPPAIMQPNPKRLTHVTFKTVKGIQESLNSSEDLSDRTARPDGSESDFSSAESLTD